jgi:hypothetical protein
VFGEPGATWLVTPHLALGAAVRVGADYQRSTITGGRALNTWTLGLGRVHLTGQLYF